MADNLDEGLEQFKYPVTKTKNKLGSGYYGEVYEAEVEGGVCAIKFLMLKDGWDQQKEKRKFIKECKDMSKLRHPNLVHFFGLHKANDSDLPGLVTEKLWTDLWNFITKLAPKPDLPVYMKFSILCDIAGGLKFLHSRSIIHRDLTAQNVLLNSAMVAKIADLGMARIITGQQLSEMSGNKFYMPPEAWSRTYNESLDIFSFGVLMLFTFLETLPEVENFTKIPAGGKCRSESIEQLQSVIGGHPELINIIGQCLFREQENRPVINDVKDCLDTAVNLTPETEFKKNKFELIQAIREVKEKRERLQAEMFQLKDRLRGEQTEHESEKQQLQDQITGLEQTMEQKEKENNLALKEKEGELSEKVTQMEQEKREAEQEKREALEAKEGVFSEKVTQMEQEKKEAVERKEEEILKELNEFIVEKKGGQTCTPNKAVNRIYMCPVNLSVWVIAAVVIAILSFAIGMYYPSGNVHHSNTLLAQNESVEAIMKGLLEQYYVNSDDHVCKVNEEKKEDKVTEPLATKTNTAKLKKNVAVMIIGSITLPVVRETSDDAFQNTVPQIPPPQLSDEDRQNLTNLGLPQYQWDNLHALMAIYSRSEIHEVVLTNISRPGMELSHKYILEQIEVFLQHNHYNVLLHYYGNGGRNTGDWCFNDGCITFNDITQLYMEHRHHKHLVIVSDCHSSGQWIAKAAKYLDDKRVKPCGHSAREKGILWKIFASSRAGQDSTELLYTTRAMKIEAGGITYLRSKQLGNAQKTTLVSFMDINCGKRCQKNCTNVPEETWLSAVKQHYVCGDGQDCKVNKNKKEERDAEQQPPTKTETKKTKKPKKDIAVMIIGSIALPVERENSEYAFQSVVSQLPTPQLSDEDHQSLTNLGLPQYQWDNLKALMAISEKSERNGVVAINISRPGMELSYTYVLEQIKTFLRNGGAAIHYYGNGGRNTGDWCFIDGCITFNDIAELYMKHRHRKRLSIVSDCHSSGQWIAEAAKYLDNKGVKPCGHSARENGFLWKIFASSRAGQDSTELLYTTRAMEIDGGGITYMSNVIIGDAQKTTLVNFMDINCGKGCQKNCTNVPKKTWLSAVKQKYACGDGQGCKMNKTKKEERDTEQPPPTKTEKKKTKKPKDVAVMIIGSIALPVERETSEYAFQNVVPQIPTPQLSDEDRQNLTNLGLPQYKWDNLNALMAIYSKSERYEVVSVNISRPGMELSHKYILEQIEVFLQHNSYITVLHYYGNGGRNTGDWCFNDGCITFNDIAELYMKYRHRKRLSIVSDCHSSGQWIAEAAKYLDDEGVKPCGHSAMEKGILWKIYTSSRAGQDSTELLYTTRAMDIDGEHLNYPVVKISAIQKTTLFDFIHLRCGKKWLEQCAIDTTTDWQSTVECHVCGDGRVCKENENTKNKDVAVMIIGSIALPVERETSDYAFQNVVPQIPPPQLSDEDRQNLTNLGLPQYQWDNLNALMALYNKSERYEVVSVNISRPGMELSRKYILEQIEVFLQCDYFNAVLYYYGNGGRDTGDWCFNDGCITFNDITELYMKYRHGIRLSIVSDCHSSGQWIAEAAKYLDDLGVKPCGHSAREEGFLWKIFASSRAGQDSTELLHTTRAMKIKEGNVYYYRGIQISPTQMTTLFDFRHLRCGKEQSEKCTVDPKTNWKGAVKPYV